MKHTPWRRVNVKGAFWSSDSPSHVRRADSHLGLWLQTEGEQTRVLREGGSCSGLFLYPSPFNLPLFPGQEGSQRKHASLGEKLPLCKGPTVALQVAETDRCLP